RLDFGAHPLQYLAGLPAHAGPVEQEPPSPPLLAEEEVLPDGEVLRHGEVLIHHLDTQLPAGSGRRGDAHPLAAVVELSRIRVVVAAEEGKERGLPGAVVADNP